MLAEATSIQCLNIRSLELNVQASFHFTDLLGSAASDHEKDSSLKIETETLLSLLI